MTGMHRASKALVVLLLALALPAEAVERDTLAPGLPAGAKPLPVAPSVPITAPVEASAPVIPALLDTLETAAAPQPAQGPQAPVSGLESADAPRDNVIPAVAAGTNAVLDQLSPGNSAKVGDEQASRLAARLVDPSLSVSQTAAPVSVPGRSDADPELAPWRRDHALSSSEVPSGKPAAQPRPSLHERKHYASLWIRNIWFYIYTNIRNKWGPYLGYWRKLRDSGVPPIVSKPREFFATMRVFGQTGYFYVPGFGPVEDAEVVREARATFRRFFDGPGITDKERASFDGFVERALLFNNKRRAASKFRANVRDNMLKASTMTPDKIAPFFDALPIVARTDDFQSKGAADAVLSQFKRVVLEAIAEEPADAKDRITGVILIGSFALGAATPKSDFDIEPLTADGGDGRVRLFAEKVTKRWAELGRQTTNPVSFHYFGYLNSRWEIRAIHHEPYIVISPDPAIVADLAMRPGEGPSHVPSRLLTPAGRLLRGLQYAAVYATSLITPAKYPDKL